MIVKLPKADGVRGILTLIFDRNIPDIDTRRPGWEAGWRNYYAEHAVTMVDSLQSHLPGGLVDAVFAELARRKASILRVVGE